MTTDTRLMGNMCGHRIYMTTRPEHTAKTAAELLELPAGIDVYLNPVDCAALVRAMSLGEIDDNRN